MCIIYVCRLSASMSPSPELHRIFVHVTRDLASVLIWWRCDALCISGIMGNVTFAQPNGQEYATRRRLIHKVGAGFKSVEALGRIVIRGPYPPSML